MKVFNTVPMVARPLHWLTTPTLARCRGAVPRRPGRERGAGVIESLLALAWDKRTGSARRERLSHLAKACAMFDSWGEVALAYLLLDEDSRRFDATPSQGHFPL